MKPIAAVAELGRVRTCFSHKNCKSWRGKRERERDQEVQAQARERRARKERTNSENKQ